MYLYFFVCICQNPGIMNKFKDAEVNFDRMKNEEFISPSHLVLIVQEQLERIERIRKNNYENKSLNQQVKKLEKELEEYEVEVKSKQLQLHQLTHENSQNKHNIQSRNGKIQKLLQGIEKRDRIFDFFHNNNGEENQEVFLDSSNGNRIFEFRNKQTFPFTIKTERLSPISHEESTIDIDIEPASAVEFYDSDANELILSETNEDSVQLSSPNIVTSEPLAELNQDIVTIQLDTSDDTLKHWTHNFDELPVQKEDEKNKETGKFSSPVAKNSPSSSTTKSDKTSKFIPIKLKSSRWYPHRPANEISPPPPPPPQEEEQNQQQEEEEKPVENNLNQDELLSQQHEQNQQEQEQQQELAVDDYSQYYEYYQNYQNYQNYYAQWQNYAYYYALQQQQQYQYQPTYFQPPQTTQQSSEAEDLANEDVNPADNVMNVPEILRYNFAISEDSELFDCPIALQFWFDPTHSNSTKYFIKLYDDSDRNWRLNKYFVLIEQIGLRHPNFHLLKYNEMLEKLEKTHSKRIWLDVRNFNSIFGLDDYNNSILKTETFSTVTHLSFGYRIIKNAECASTPISESTGVKCKTLLKFMSKRLSNLEYLAVNNSMLISDIGSNNNNKKHNIVIKKEIPSLTTIRLVHGNSKFPTEFIPSLLKMCPKLQHLFQLPLHFLDGLHKKLIDLRLVQSFFVNREFYFTKDGPLNYIRHLSLLSEQNFWNSLQELDCRTFFLPGDQSTLDICHHWLSQVLSHHHSSLKVLKLQPFPSTSSSSLIIPRLQNLTTFKFYLTKKLDAHMLSFFSTGSSSSSNSIYDPIKFPSLTTIEIILEFSINKSGNNSSISSFHHHPPAQLFLQHFPRNIFKPRVSFNSVTDLKLHGFNILDCMKDISELFPQLQILRLHDLLREICQVLPSCFQFWPGLKQLHFNVDTNTQFGNLDNVLLGTSREQCEIIQKEIPQVQEREIDKLFYSSICQLKELQLFKIILRSTGIEKPENQRPIITELGARVLSKFGSQLKVQIAFEDKMSNQEKYGLITSLHILRSFPCSAHTYSIEI